jgi:hypothetical protein
MGWTAEESKFESMFVSGAEIAHRKKFFRRI